MHFSTHNSTPSPLLLLLLTASTANAHMAFASPATWGLKTKGGGQALELPLNKDWNPKEVHGMKLNDEYPWLNHGVKRDTDEFITLKPGSTPSFPIVCGEAMGDPDTAPAKCKLKPDFHNGGGCAISISYEKDPEPKHFTVISVNDRCPVPKEGDSKDPDRFKHEFPMPDNLPACQECVCGWHWVPDPSSSAAEMYMNAFNCKVDGTNTGTIKEGKRPLWFGVKGFLGGSGERPMYKNKFKEGAQVLTIEGGKEGGKKEKRWEA